MVHLMYAHNMQNIACVDCCDLNSVDGMKRQHSLFSDSSILADR